MEGPSTHDWAAFIGVLTGAITTALLRLLDWFLPRGRHSRWAERHGVPNEDEDEKG